MSNVSDNRPQTTDRGPRTTDQGQRTLKTAYLDCSSGVSGDMFLGALLDAGLPAERLRAELRKIPLGDYELRQSRGLRAGLAGTRVEIVVPEKQPERHLRDIEQLIEGSALTKTAKERAIEVFGRIAEAEGKLHDKPAAKVHFHEVGAVDAIIDVAGACAGLEVSILCPPERADALAQLLFDETTTIGLRIHEARRKVLDRELVTVETRYGVVRVKVARRDGRVLNVAPEYEDCQRL